jgi:pimeloyl-ACP methyl ester carboxylesterase
LPAVPTIESDGAKLAVEVIGEGEPVTVLGHGLTGSRRDLMVFTPFLPGTKVVFDFLGHGESSAAEPGSYSMNHFAADMEAVADAFGATCAGGWSLGAGAILRLLTRRPDRFERLVFLLPAKVEDDSEVRADLLELAWLLETRTVEEAADAVLAREDARGAFDQFPTSREIRRSTLLGLNPASIPHAIRECLDDPPVGHAVQLARVTTPALVVGQEGDPLHEAEVARELAAALPNAELLIFPDPHALIRDIPMVVQKVSAFLSVERGGGGGGPPA